jgi:hypothetical protein
MCLERGTNVEFMTAGIIVRLSTVAACVVIVSCAGRSVEPDRPAPAVAAPPPGPPETVGKAKLWTGSVRFVGFSEQQLDEFRVIPEQASSVYRPMNALYRGVDGFWWKHDRRNWFKIPGHCEVVVWPCNYAGETPQADEADEEVLIGRDRPRTWMKCKPWLTQALLWNGRPHKAGWYPNAGKSSIGARYPW